MIDPLRAKLQKHLKATDEDEIALITEVKMAFNNDFEKSCPDHPRHSITY